MEEKRLKIRLELHVVGDGRTFLNYWDVNGNDVIAEIKENKLFQGYDEAQSQITLQSFIEQVKERFK
jgi:hypothetical protein